MDLKILTVHVESQWDGYATLGDKVRAEKPDILIMTRPLIKDVATLPEMRAMHLIRDPRDIVVSGYFSHRNSHPEVVGGIPWPELVAHRKRLLELDKDAGMAEEVEFSSFFLEPLMDWDYTNPSILEMRMEDMTTSPIDTWLKALTHLDLLGEDGFGKMAACHWNLADRRGVPKVAAVLRKVLPKIPVAKVPPAYVADVNDRYSFTRLSKSDRKPGEVDENNHYRKGVAGDWVNHLTERHLEIVRARYGDLVTRLGYK